MRQGNPSRFPVVLMGVILVAALSLAPACENNRTKLTKEQSEHGLGIPDSHSSTERKYIDPRCELDQMVVEPAENTPEWVIFQLIESAIDKSDEAKAFERFYSHFDESKAESWVKQQYWPRARKYAGKYVQGDETDGVTYKICRKDTRSDGSVRIFIQSLDPKKSNPPQVLKQDDNGKWKVTGYTP